MLAERKKKQMVYENVQSYLDIHQQLFETRIDSEIDDTFTKIEGMRISSRFVRLINQESQFVYIAAIHFHRHNVRNECSTTRRTRATCCTCECVNLLIFHEFHRHAFISLYGALYSSSSLPSYFRYRYYRQRYYFSAAQFILIITIFLSCF